jgi:hypothetical protein
MATLFKGTMDVQPGGWAIDKKFPEIIYVPHDANFELHAQKVSWTNASGTHNIKLSPGKN